MSLKITQSKQKQVTFKKRGGEFVGNFVNAISIAF